MNESYRIMFAVFARILFTVDVAVRYFVLLAY
jgi:hypothetical protein